MIRSRALLAISVATLLASCHLSRAQYNTIDAWLLCDECINHERESVRAIGGKAVHTLDQALIGPSPGRIANKVAQFTQMYGRLSTPALPESTYVRELRSNYIAKYQYRAAVSLGDIGGGRSVKALRRARDAAVTRGYRADVVKLIDVVLALTVASSGGGAQTGSLSTTTPRFGDTVRVERGAGQTWTGDEQVRLHGSAFADSLVVRRWAADSLAFLAVGSLGDYAVAISWLGQPAGRQVIPLRIVAPGYTSHDTATATILTPDSADEVRYLLLPSRPGGTTDLFKIQPGSPTSVTARVTSSGLTLATLRWYTCSPFSLLPPPAGPSANVTGYVIDERGDLVAGVMITVVGTALGTVTDSLGRFMLSVNAAALPFPTLRASRINFRPSQMSVHVPVDSIQLGIIRSSVSEAFALARSGSTVTIPGGDCRFLQILVPSGGGPRTLRLRLTSP